MRVNHNIITYTLNKRRSRKIFSMGYTSFLLLTNEDQFWLQDSCTNSIKTGFETHHCLTEHEQCTLPASLSSLHLTKHVTAQSNVSYQNTLQLMHLTQRPWCYLPLPALGLKSLLPCPKLILGGGPPKFEEGGAGPPNLRTISCSRSVRVLANTGLNSVHRHNSHWWTQVVVGRQGQDVCMQCSLKDFLFCTREIKVQVTHFKTTWKKGTWEKH